MTEELIHLDGIKKVFSTDEVETHALDGVHLVISKGEYVAIEGPSGSGKTTLLSILGLLDVPSSGDYLLQGRPVGSLGARERASAIARSGSSSRPSTSSATSPSRRTSSCRSSTERCRAPSERRGSPPR